MLRIICPYNFPHLIGKKCFPSPCYYCYPKNYKNYRQGSFFFKNCHRRNIEYHFNELSKFPRSRYKNWVDNKYYTIMRFQMPYFYFYFCYPFEQPKWQYKSVNEQRHSSFFHKRELNYLCQILKDKRVPHSIEHNPICYLKFSSYHPVPGIGIYKVPYKPKFGVRNLWDWCCLRERLFDWIDELGCRINFPLPYPSLI